MNVVVTTEHRFDRLPDGTVWTSGAHAYPFWTRYLSVFEGVKVLARVRAVDSAPKAWVRADGELVEFAPIPYYVGPWQYLGSAFAVRDAIRRAVTEDDAVVMRVSSHIAGSLEPSLRREGRPYGLEVVSDPFDVYSPGAVRHWLRPFFRQWFTRQLRRQCMGAAGVSYVTRAALQARYPSVGYSEGTSDVEISEDAILHGENAFTTYYSSVELTEADWAHVEREAPEPNNRFRMITVGSLAQMYKGVDVLIQAVAICVKAKLNVCLVVVGEGKHRPELERLASALGLSERIEFLGQLPAGEAVRKQLDLAHLFVLPSRCEGLPRAMIEAMARALPCIGTAVGGIPELLPAEDLVPPSDAHALANKIHEVLSSPLRMSAMSLRNLGSAQNYRDEVLEARRHKFLKFLRRSTEDWSAAPSRATPLPYSTAPSSEV